MKNYGWFLLIAFAISSCFKGGDAGEHDLSRLREKKSNEVSESGQGLFKRDLQGYAAVKVRVRGLTVDSRSNTPVVLLEDVTGRRILPIWIGYAEARAIAIVLHDVEVRRPLTHDLIRNILEKTGAEVRGVIVSELKGNIFFARLYLKTEKEEVVVDSRPSDAIALSLRTHSPIYVAESVLKDAETIPMNVVEAGDAFIKTGMEVQDITQDLAPYFGVSPGGGVVVTKVEPDSPAGRAGLMKGDVILEINGSKISDTDNFVNVVRKNQDVLKVKVKRGNQRLNLEVYLEGF